MTSAARAYLEVITTCVDYADRAAFLLSAILPHTGECCTNADVITILRVEFVRVSYFAVVLCGQICQVPWDLIPRNFIHSEEGLF